MLAAFACAEDNAIEELRSRLEAMEKQHRQQMSELEGRYEQKINALQKRVDELEAKKATDAAIRESSPKTGNEAIEERLANLELELQIQKLREETTSSQLQDRVDLHIYGSASYSDFENKHSAFDTRNIAMAASADLSSRLRFFSIVELESSPDGGSEVELDQGWMEYRIEEWFKPRFGVILVPFGRFNMEHFDILNDLTSRPLMAEHLVPISWAESGMGVTGNLPITDIWAGTPLRQAELDYQIYLINGMTNNLTDTSTVGTNGNLESDNNDNKGLAGRLGVKLAPGQELGISGYTGKYDDSHDIYGLDLDWRFTWGPAELLGEYATLVLEDGGYEADGVTEVPRRYTGWYVQGNYHFWFDWLNGTFLGRQFENPTFTAVVRYGMLTIDDDGDAGTGDNEERRLSLGVNYRPTQSWAFKLEYQFNETEEEPISHGNADGVIFSVTATF